MDENTQRATVDHVYETGDGVQIVKPKVSPVRVVLEDADIKDKVIRTSVSIKNAELLFILKHGRPLFHLITQYCKKRKKNWPENNKIKQRKLPKLECPKFRL